MSADNGGHLALAKPATRPKNDSAPGGALKGAEVLLAKLRIPAGSAQVSSDPTPDHRLGGQPATYPMILETVEAYTFWRVPKSPDQTVAWLEANRLEESTVIESGSTDATPPRAPSELQPREVAVTNSMGREVIFSLPTQHEKTRRVWLEAYVVPLKTNESALRVSAVVEWILPRPRVERIPAGVQTVSVKLRDPEHHLAIARTFRSPATVLDILQAIEGLQRAPRSYGVRSQCGALLFRHAFASVVFWRVGAVARVAVNQCSPTKVWIEGRSQPSLEGEASLIRRIADIVRHDASSGRS